MARGSRFRLPLLFLLLGGILLLLWHFAPVSPPARIGLNRPALLVSGLNLAASPSRLLWSPDGRYLAILGATSSQAVQVTVVSTASGERMGTLETDGEGVWTTAWASGNGLWVGSKTGWDLYHHPFRKRAGRRVERPEPFKPLDGILSAVAFQPDSGFIASVARHSTRGEFRLLGWKEGKAVWDLPFRPRERGSYREVSRMAFRPDGGRLALTVSGWKNWEDFGRDELWVLECGTGELNFVHAGATEAWLLSVDHLVQEVAASWAPDSRTIVFGDSTFGVEAIQVGSGSRQRLLPRKWGGEARAGRDWVAYESELSPGSVAVVSRDGRWWGEMPGEWAGWQAEAYEWDRSGQRLALVGSGMSGQGYSLLLWDVRRE